MTLPLILASASPRRLELMRQLGLKFETVPSDADELLCEELSPGELARINACRKACAVAEQYPEAVVVGMDTMVALNGRVYGKPSSMDHARKMLAELAGHEHVVVTGVCLMQLRARRKKVFAELTRVTLRSLAAREIDAYYERANPLDKAGAYGIQEHGELIVESIQGSFSNVVGLPMERVQAELRDFLETQP
jgi:septum formation protein